MNQHFAGSFFISLVFLDFLMIPLCKPFIKIRTYYRMNSIKQKCLNYIETSITKRCNFLTQSDVKRILK